MAATGRYEADQIVGIFLMGGGFIVFPLAAILAVLSLFNWRTIVLFILIFVFLNGVSAHNNITLNIVSTLIYPCATLWVMIWKKRINSSAQKM